MGPGQNKPSWIQAENVKGVCNSFFSYRPQLWQTLCLWISSETKFRLCGFICIQIYWLSWFWLCQTFSTERTQKFLFTFFFLVLSLSLSLSLMHAHPLIHNSTHTHTPMHILFHVLCTQTQTLFILNTFFCIQQPLINQSLLFLQSKSFVVLRRRRPKILNNTKLLSTVTGAC